MHIPPTPAAGVLPLAALVLLVLLLRYGKFSG
jgi:hypothetical protein